MKVKNHKKSPVAVLCSLLGTAILIIIIVMCIPATVPKVLGYQAYTVISGSMEPAIPTGSLVYVESVDPKSLEEGDIIAFYGFDDGRSVVTHRVIENRENEAEFITKGDANEATDMNPVKYSNYIGQVKKTIPGIGVAAQILTGTQGKISAACMIGVAVILHVISAIFRKQR